MDTKQALIIGLGQFGMALARTLSERGVDVLAVDLDRQQVQLASSFVAQAACFDARDEESLKRAGPERRDLCVCAMGNESRESSIIVTALLRQIHDVLIELLLRSSRDDDQLHDAALLQAWHRLERKTGRPVGPLPIPLPVPGVGTTSQADEDGADGC